jgi:hypothetical protein
MEIDFARAFQRLKLIQKRCAVLTVKEAAKLFRVSNEHVIALIDDGSLSGIDIAAKNASRSCWRVPVQSMLDFARSRASGATRPIGGRK